MPSPTFMPRLDAAERARLDAQARAAAHRLRAEAIRDGWSAVFRLPCALVAAAQRRWRAVSP